MVLQTVNSTRLMQYPLLTISAQTITQSICHTHIFGRIVRFPLTTPHAKEESAGEKGRFIYFSEREEKACTETGLGGTGALDVQERR